jgi:VIT1/CCC1 family predicted Fe2+/Mn2+ transporter
VHGRVHRGGRIGWLRAAVLGANDGLISTSSLVVGVAVSGQATAERFYKERKVLQAPTRQSRAGQGELSHPGGATEPA